MNRKEFLLDIIKQIGAFQLKHFQTDIEFDKKTSGIDVVSFVDTHSEEMFVSKLKELFSNDDILGEESYDEHKRYDTTSLWIIDPLDGTFPFKRGFKDWGPMIAYIKDGEVQFSALYVPYFDELFFADETGAYCNGKKISVSSTADLKDSIVEIKSEDMTRMRPSVGVAIYNFCAINHFTSIATGKTDGYVNASKPARPWDIIPGIFLVRQAGGKVTNKNKEDLKLFESRYIASNNVIHDKLADIYNNGE